MPSSMTHTYFGLDVLKELPPKYQEKIKHKLEHFKLFSQGSDPFMFYHFFLGKKAKQMGKIQNQMHHQNTQSFFLNTIEYIYQKNLQQNEEVMSYLYGYICHYYLDLHTHPFIYYKSGLFQPNNKNTYKYNGLHQEIEYQIDLYLIEKKEKQKPQKFKIYKEIFQTPTISITVQQMINETIKKTYEISNIMPKYLRSIQYMKHFFHYANYDPYGIKLKIYHLIDKISPKSSPRLQELSYYNTYKENKNYLNLTHQEWYYPWDKSKKFNTSFLDLYQQALKDATNTIKQVTDLLEEKQLNRKKLKNLFPNLSFSTGRPCQENLTFKYFEF
ncbi:MAG: zinc dependent phospholipase C family protein [Erysipelotrichaceae bacterium]|nr:zinc dependent phospholipase C family protein [Erysipelotrichaceae bacterium]